jgi:NodT family efflux transporter outer membrane factor (OMF) lipoprotein
MVGPAACAVGPDYVRPPTPEDVAWHAPLEGGLSAEPAKPELLASFWQVLNDPLLSELIARAVSGNLDVAAAEARVRAARADRQIALGAFFPQFDAKGNGERNSGRSRGSGIVSSGGSPITVGGGKGSSTLYSVGLDASWELDVFGGLRRGLEAADADLGASQADLRGTLVTLVGELALSYIDVRSQQERLRIAEANLVSQQQTFDLTSWRAQAGLGTDLDVEQARTILAQTRAAVPLLRTNLVGSENRIAVLLGEPPGAVAALLDEPKPIPVTPREVAVGVPADTLAQRPDVRRAELQLAAQTARVGVATANAYPKLQALGSIGLEALTVGGLFSSLAKAGTWTVAGAISQPVFHGGELWGKIDEQDALRAQAIASYESTVLAALEEVENALIAYAQEQDRRAALAEGAAAAERALALAQDQYGSGLIDFPSVLDAQRSLLSLQDQLATSEGQVSSNLVRLYKALGGGWPVGAAS